jgi:cholest-4-en-3-one 26-monooxygenase
MSAMTQPGGGEPGRCRVAGVDLLDGRRFRAGGEHAMFDALRREDPVSWHAAGDDPADGFWALVRHADVVAVNRDWATFTTASGTLIGERGGFLGLGDDFLSLAADPPRHTQMRLVVNRAFTRPAIARQAQAIARIVAETLDEADAVAADGTCDFAADVADVLPARAIGEILGVAESDRDQLGAWTAQLTHATSATDGGGTPDLGEAGVSIFTYARELAADRRQRGADTVIDSMLRAEVEGRRLTVDEFALFFLLLFTAGTETTRAAAAGGAHVLLSHRDEWTRCRDEPARWPVAVEEVARWTTPVAYFRRTATKDCVIRDQALRAGDAVVMWFSAANRDPEVFADPHRFDAGRGPNPHVAFGGGGPHFCLGAHLARLELRLLFETMASRYPALELAGEPTWKESNFTPGVATLPVYFGARAHAGAAS